jgi:eukaryotic-like serine/threonine-protein kinase
MTTNESRFIGRVLRDKWRIDSKIARGGMGTVFVARHKNNGSTAAIKILNPEFSRDEDTRSRFMQEGYAANQVNHPSVVRILDDDVTEDGFAYLVMELLEGELLEQRRIRLGGKLELAEVYELADELLDVLAAAHAKRIVHRDVKPDNLFITREGRLKVLDFGFAQMKSRYRTEQTATGFLIGTPGFMAPEQAMGNRSLVDAQTDVWAVGATMFLLLSGQPCHAGDSPAEMLALAANFAVRSITTLEPRLPTKLSYAIDRALAFKKSERWPDARSMQSALRLVPGRPRKEPMRRSLADLGAETDQDAIIEIDDVVSGEDETVTDDAREIEGDFDDTDENPQAPPMSVDARTPFIHPASTETPTIIAADDPPTIAAPSPVFASAMAVPRLNAHSEPPLEGTMVMESRPVHAAVLRSSSSFEPQAPPYPPRSSFEPQAPPYPPPPPVASPPYAPPPAQQPHALSASQPMMFHAPSAPVADAGGGSRVLTFVLVAGITMVVVILTGLLVILGSD